MTYELIQPPFTLKFRDMSRNELDDYLQWFLGVIPERIANSQVRFGRPKVLRSGSLTAHLRRWTLSENGCAARSNHDLAQTRNNEKSHRNLRFRLGILETS